MRVLLGTPFPVLSVLLLRRTARRAGRRGLAARQRGAPVYVAGPRVFDRIAGFPVHRGVLALAQRRRGQSPWPSWLGVGAAVVVEGVNDHENLGAIFRNAAALGAGAVLLDPACCDPLYRRSVRVSVGHVLRVPFARLTPWPAALADLVAGRIRRRGPRPGAPDTSSPWPADCRATAGGAGRRRRDTGSATRRGPRPPIGSASRWQPESTRSTWPPPWPSPCTACVPVSGESPVPTVGPVRRRALRVCAVSDFNFQGTVAVVTGGAGGIGRPWPPASARRDREWRWSTCGQAAAEAAAAELPGAIGVGADVGDPDRVSGHGGRGGRRPRPDRHLLLECRASAPAAASATTRPGSAAGGSTVSPTSTPPERCCRPWSARRSGAMVITASAAGLLMMMQSAPYTVTKHASVAIAEWLAVNYGGPGAQVHCVCPQGVRTPMVASDPQASRGGVERPDHRAGGGRRRGGGRRPSQSVPGAPSSRRCTTTRSAKWRTGIAGWPGCAGSWPGSTG